MQCLENCLFELTRLYYRVFYNVCCYDCCMKFQTPDEILRDDDLSRSSDKIIYESFIR